MADKILKSLTLPGLNDRYVIPQVDPTHSIPGRPADAAQFGTLMGDVTDLKHHTDNM